MSGSQHRCVFVGNIPYDATEEQLIAICEEVGPVVSFRLVTDRETGKPKGYGFCEFRDEETALSARRNLSGYDLNGRQLRVDFAENEKNTTAAPDRSRADQAPRGPLSAAVPAGEAVGYSAAAQAAGVMAGALGSQQVPVMAGQGQNGGNPGGLAGNDALTSHIASMSKQQLYELMCQLKALIQQDQQQARQLLVTHPQLTKALFQAQILLGMVRIPQVRQPPLPPVSAPMPAQNFISPPPPPAAYSQQSNILPQAPPVPQQPRPPPLPPMPPSQMQNFQGPPPPFAQHQPPFSMGMPFQSQGQPPLPHQPPPQHSFQHPNMNMERNYQQPPFGMDGGGPVYGGQMQMQGPPPPQQLPLEMDQQHLLQQVMNLTPEQINSLPPDQRQQVLQLQQAIRFNRP